MAPPSNMVNTITATDNAAMTFLAVSFIDASVKSISYDRVKIKIALLTIAFRQ